MKWWTLLMVLSAWPVLAADKREQVKGLWASDGSIFSVYEKAGQLHGEIIALKDPVYTLTEDAARAGMTRVDDNNPDEALRNRPILGLEMFTGYQFEGDQWQGNIYDPESGKTYKSKVQLARDGRLEIRGYTGIPMFGRTAQFDPAGSCLGHIMEMLEMTKHSELCLEK
ncbi:MAG: DUF2147 domain-containing protein [bacterium]